MPRAARFIPFPRASMLVLLACAGAFTTAAGADNPAAPTPPPTTHWAFVKPARPAEPAVADAAWVRNPIDRFVLHRIEAAGLRPSPEAAKETLLRRLSLDLTGLPPTVAEIDVFLADAAPDAYEKQVERLLASPHYGERWGRHWLDAARYADSNGYSQDNPRSIWPYRDWVIDALNKDTPFDQFAVEQLAGDMLPGATVAQRVATGFHRNTQINTEGGIDPEQFRVESIVDRVATTGTVFLGLTIACAQCHDHKFDPVSQREYYQLFAFFNNADEPTLDVESEGQDTATTLVMQERAQPRETAVFVKGDFTRRAEVVTPGVPSVLHPMTVEKPDRLALARWLFHEDNPLTARVTVNRVWQQYFGRGIVETENDFGTTGTAPTHPELLDWLATEFRARSWSLKALHRLIVTSATYRQSSGARPELAQADPYNKLLARQNRLRLDAEIVRDVGLSASGLLNAKIGGPGVFPPQPDGATRVGQVYHEWRTSTGPDRFRRGMYTFFFRASPHPLLNTFDAPDATSTCTRRLRSTTPLQALTLLNDQAFVEFAQGLATRALKEGGADDSARLDYGFRLCTGRKSSDDERQILARLLAGQRAAFEAAPEEVNAIAPAELPPGVDAKEAAAWTIVARALLNLDETITRD